MIPYSDDYGTGTSTSSWIDEYVIARWRYECFITTSKWWRWYDIFRTWEDAKLLPMLFGVPSMIKRIQERLSSTQRAKQKRRMYVQKLRA